MLSASLDLISFVFSYIKCSVFSCDLRVHQGFVSTRPLLFLLPKPPMSPEFQEYYQELPTAFHSHNIVDVLKWKGLMPVSDRIVGAR